MPASDVPDADPPLHVVVMGVAGVGKSTVALGLAAELDAEMAEGDDFHPAAYKEKMQAGTPLTDEDRQPWLRALADWTAERHAKGESTVLTCSALRKAYRDVLRSADSATLFVHLEGPEQLIADRMSEREHFMPVSLLRSQFEMLEPLDDDEAGVTVDIRGSVDEVVSQALSGIARHRPRS